MPQGDADRFGGWASVIGGGEGGDDGVDEAGRQLDEGAGTAEQGEDKDGQELHRSQSVEGTDGGSNPDVRILG